MKLYPYSFAQLLIVAMLFCAFPAFSQVEKGFKYLADENWEKAVTAFAKDSSDADVQAVAFFGLAKTLSATKNPDKNYGEAMKYQVRAAECWENLSRESRTDLTAKYKDDKFSGSAIERVRTNAATAAWRALEKKTDLQFQDVSDYLTAFPYPPVDIIDAVNDKKQELLGDAVRKATTYDQLSFLLKNYREDIRNAFPTALEVMEKQLFDLFMAEKGADWLGKFYRENPTHPLNFDDGKDMFPEAWGSEDLNGFLQFLFQYPNSLFAPYIRKKAIEFMAENPVSDETAATLKPEEKAALEELKMEAAGELIDPYADFNDSMYDKWLNYTRKLAPSDRAFTAFDKMYKYYILNRKWKRASEVLHTGRLAFPAQATEIGDLLTIIDGPEYGITPVNLGATINADGSEYVPVPSTDGKTLYFCAAGRKDNLDGEDVFVSYRKDTGWTKPQVIKELSGFYNQAPVSISADGQRLYLFSSGKPQVTSKTATGWTTPVPLDIDLTEFGWVGLVQIAANNKIMVFEARKSNGFFGGGDTDIYIAERDSDGKWGDPAKLDSLINSTGDDRSPFLHPDMRTMYFSTNGKLGMGGMDVYKTTRIGDSWTRWTKPVNLGKEINTMSDDWAYKISTDGVTAWFANRTTDYDQDIFYVTLPDSMRPEPVKVVTIDTKDSKGLPFGGKVVVTDPKTGKVIGEYDTNPTGATTSIPVPNDRDYVVTLKKEGVFPTSTTVHKDEKPDTKATEVKLKPVTVDDMVNSGEAVALNLLFDYDKSDLRAESMPELQNLVNQVKAKNYKINLLGYSDNAGSPDYNMTLSQRRAEATRKALIDLGVPADRISAKGYGEASPVADNTSEEGRSKNRRVELKLSN